MRQRKTARRRATSTGAIVPVAMTEADAAHYVGFSRGYLKKGRLFGYGPPFVRTGRAITYRRADLDAWINAHVVDVAKGA